jgi:hypothetical protein
VESKNESIKTKTDEQLDALLERMETHGSTTTPHTHTPNPTQCNDSSSLESLTSMMLEMREEMKTIKAMFSGSDGPETYAQVISKPKPGTKSNTPSRRKVESAEEKEKKRREDAKFKFVLTAEGTSEEVEKNIAGTDSKEIIKRCQEAVSKSNIERSNRGRRSEHPARNGREIWSFYLYAPSNYMLALSRIPDLGHRYLDRPHHLLPYIECKHKRH